MMQKLCFPFLMEIVRINFIYSIIINCRHFGIDGLLKMPIIIQYGSSFRCKSKNGIAFLKPLKMNMLTIKYGNRIKVDKGGRMILTGDKACFNKKNSVMVSSGGIFEIGNNFWVNAFTEFYCRKGLKFGDDVLIGFHIIIMDTDYHPIFNEQNEIINPNREVVFGNKVWIGSNVTILKGSHIGNNIVVGAGSVVTGNLLEENSIYFGNPARYVKNNIIWERN
ncbi:MAG: acyltransferase [Bacteroidales bacterium]|nr:acyltransferase [Bacteroidales bacterium]